MYTCFNRPFPSCFEPHYVSEAKCKVFHVKISFVCIWMKTNFHNNNFAQSLVFIVRFYVTRKELFNTSLMRIAKRNSEVGFVIIWDKIAQKENKLHGQKRWKPKNWPHNGREHAMPPNINGTFLNIGRPPGILPHCHFLSMISLSAKTINLWLNTSQEDFVPTWGQSGDGMRGYFGNNWCIIQQTRENKVTPWSGPHVLLMTSPPVKLREILFYL